MMRTLLAIAAASATAAVLAVPALAATKTVKVGDTGSTSFWFISKAKNHGTVTAKVGDTVKWTFTGKFPHTVAVKSGPVKFDSGAAKKSGTFSKKITKAGTYKIYCKIHGAAAQSMTLKVTK
jgi:plastocyanin